MLIMLVVVIVVKMVVIFIDQLLLSIAGTILLGPNLLIASKLSSNVVDEMSVVVAGVAMLFHCDIRRASI